MNCFFECGRVARMHPNIGNVFFLVCPACFFKNHPNHPDNQEVA